MREFRVTDATDVVRTRNGYLVRAVLQERNLSRAGLENRLRSALELPLTFGWARFPDDGSSLGLLVLKALDATGASGTAAVGVPVGEAAGAVS
jgi:hypothetical protein